MKARCPDCNGWHEVEAPGPRRMYCPQSKTVVALPEPAPLRFECPMCGQSYFGEQGMCCPKCEQSVRVSRPRPRKVQSLNRASGVPKAGGLFEYVSAGVVVTFFVLLAGLLLWGVVSRVVHVYSKPERSLYELQGERIQAEMEEQRNREYMRLRSEAEAIGRDMKSNPHLYGK